MILCCDPLARAATAASANRLQSDAAMPKIIDDVLQVVDWLGSLD
jgi:hypothetical protein